MAKPKTVVGRLSTTGWAKSDEEIIYQVLANYSNAAFSQSMIYAGHIRSFSNTEKNFGDDPDAMANRVKEDLTVLYNNVLSSEEFGEVEKDIDVSWNYVDENEVKYTLIISAEFRIRGAVIGLNRTLRLIGDDNNGY